MSHVEILGSLLTLSNPEHACGTSRVARRPS
jgi:hypothetical protein